MTPKAPISRRRLWLMRLFAMIFVPLLVLGGIELGLRLGGYGYDTGFFRLPSPVPWSRFDWHRRKPPIRIEFSCLENQRPMETPIQLMALADTWKYYCANAIPERSFKWFVWR